MITKSEYRWETWEEPVHVTIFETTLPDGMYIMRVQEGKGFISGSLLMRKPKKWWEFWR